MAGGVNPFGFSMGVLPAPRAPRQPQDLPSAPFGFAPPPSKMQQTLAILNEYNPLPAFERLLKSPMALGGTISEQDIADGLAVAGSMAGASSVVPKPANSLGIFGGRLAATADQKMLAKAEKMAAEDASRDEIWAETGWFQGPDKKWRFEIDDSAYVSRPEALAKTGRIAQADEYLQQRGISFRVGDPRLDPALQKEALQYADRPAGRDASVPLQSYMDHPQFQAAYPDSGLEVGLQVGTNYNGSHQAGTNVIRTGGGSITRGGNPGRDSTALHELQHWIQEKEGFASGGNPSSIFGHSDKKVRNAVNAEYNKLLSPSSWEDWRKNPTWDGVPEAEIRRQYEKSIADLKKIRGDVYHPINKAAQETATKNVYKRLAGETESRNVQSRMDMTPADRRANPPWWTQDFPFVDQIVTKSGDGW